MKQQALQNAGNVLTSSGISMLLRGALLSGVR